MLLKSWKKTTSIACVYQVLYTLLGIIIREIITHRLCTQGVMRSIIKFKVHMLTSPRRNLTWTTVFIRCSSQTSRGKSWWVAQSFFCFVNEAVNNFIYKQGNSQQGWHPPGCEAGGTVSPKSLLQKRPDYSVQTWQALHHRRLYMWERYIISQE